MQGRGLLVFIVGICAVLLHHVFMIHSRRDDNDKPNGGGEMEPRQDELTCMQGRGGEMEHKLRHRYTPTHLYKSALFKGFESVRSVFTPKGVLWCPKYRYCAGHYAFKGPKGT